MAPEALKRIGELVDERWPDVVVAEENLAGGLLWAVPPTVARVWVKHSIYAIDARQSRRRYGSWKPAWLLNEWLVHRYESSTLTWVDKVVVMSEEDAHDLAALYGQRSVEAVGLGTDLPVKPISETADANVAAFLGHFSWQANADAAEWLIEVIWPRVRAEAPDARLRLIGRGLKDDLIRNVAQEGIDVVGYVDNLTGALDDVAVNLVPVRLGTGVRAKFLDGLAMGLATVSTRLGARGTGAQDGVHCLTADTAEDIAAAVLRLFRDRGLRAAIGAKALELARSFTWAARAQEMESVLTRVVQDHSKHRHGNSS